MNKINELPIWCLIFIICSVLLDIKIHINTLSFVLVICKKDMNYWKYTWFILLLLDHASPFHNITANITVHDPAELGVDMKDLSLATYFNLANESKRNQQYSNYIGDAERETRRFFEWFPLKHWGLDNEVIYACYYIHTTYRNAMTDLRRYFWRRTLYKSTLEYEVGYLAHEVIWRYRTILEVYHYVQEWVGLYPQRNFAPTILVFYMYTNILQQSIVIVNLCNMMHELEKKYRTFREFGVFDDYDFGDEGGDKKRKGKSKYNRTIIEQNMAAYDRYLANLKREAKKKRREQREMRKEVLKLGKTTTRGKATPKKSHWPLHYGWSIERW